MNRDLILTIALLLLYAFGVIGWAVGLPNIYIIIALTVYVFFVINVINFKGNKEGE